tara:strand:+ start:632 stop:1138 length:507 start_codon:yes stop_codon:yes gene_type:complete
MKRHHHIIATLLLMLSSHRALAITDTRVDFSNHTIISVANLSGQLCTLADIDLNGVTITRNAPPSILANQSERSFWVSDQGVNLFFHKNGVEMTFVCGNEKFKLTSFQHACNLLPFGEIRGNTSGQLKIEYKALKGHCLNGSPGVIMWQISNKVPRPDTHVLMNKPSH